MPPRFRSKLARFRTATRCDSCAWRRHFSAWPIPDGAIERARRRARNLAAAASGLRIGFMVFAIGATPVRRFAARFLAGNFSVARSLAVGVDAANAPLRRPIVFGSIVFAAL